MLEVMVEDVKHWVCDKAHEVADAYEPPWSDAFANESLHELVVDTLDTFASDRCTGLAIIAEYGWSQALIGDQGFASPWQQFQDEVEDAAKAYLEERGYEFD